MSYPIEGYPLQELTTREPRLPLDAALLAELRNQEEDLARPEHYRWMTWRLLDRWRPGERRGNVLKIHPDIKEYEKLAESTKEKDRVNIRTIPTLIQDGRLKVVRQVVSGENRAQS